MFWACSSRLTPFFTYLKVVSITVRGATSHIAFRLKGIVIDTLRLI